MSSIRNRFFVILSSLVISIIILLLLANNFLLQDFYISRKEEAFEDYFQQINELDESEYSSSTELFRQIELTTNADIVIVDQSGNSVYFSRPIDENIPQRPLPPTTSSEFEFKIISIPEIPGQSLVLQGELSNGYHVELRSPISAIVENISFINEFLLYVGIIGVILSLTAAFIIANKITKPIREINETTKKMKNLDFSHLIVSTSKDEIGELSENINNMAVTLATTFDNLNEELSLNKRLTKKRTELLNNVSHELKTPLALIQGYAEGLSLNIGTNKEKRDYYTQVITDEAINMNHIIEKLLDIEDLDSNIQSKEKEDVKYVDYIKSRINKYKMSIKKKNITLVERYCSEVNIYIDTYLTDRIITNFITNAINYCNSCGVIRVTVEDNNNTIKTKIYNSHKGLTEEQIIHIWDSFYKIDQARTRDVGGHGLGLSIVKSIQENLNEEYGVNNVDDGVEFWFNITK